MSDMTGTKATALEAWAGSRNRAFVRFDYRGHGASSGAFEDGTIGTWLADALAVLDGVTEGPQILVGSSMGGWIALLVARARPERVAGLLGIAAAPDFTRRMWREEFGDTERAAIERDGRVTVPSEYSEEGYVITRDLLEEAERHVLLNNPIPIRCPVRLLHGMQDEAVPWATSLRIAEQLEADDVETILVRSGDHRLSEPADLERMTQTLERLIAATAGA
ncbi:MAG: alpha/beta hydrolase [Alphaproteobacteria bacterium]|nr:alpha/beta hydrolase [Alphaproteobacteria bacterium]